MAGSWLFLVALAVLLLLKYLTLIFRFVEPPALVSVSAALFRLSFPGTPRQHTTAEAFEETQAPEGFSGGG